MHGLGVIFGNYALLCACERMSRHRLCKSSLIQIWSGADCASARLGLVPKHMFLFALVRALEKFVFCKQQQAVKYP